MNKFARWSGIVHSILSKSHPKLKLGQSQEILAAAFGHRTYASLRSHDLTALQRDAKYILFDEQMVLSRAVSVGIPITTEEWRAAERSLWPSGVSGEAWLIHEEGMHRAAKVTFEDESHERINEIVRSIGSSDGHWAKSTHCHSADGTLPEELKFSVYGEVWAFSVESSLAVPVVGEVVFGRVGRRFYSIGKLVAVEQCGQPREYEPEHHFEIYSMSED